MLVNFYIDPDAIDNDTNAYHIGALRTKWQSLGVLSHPSHDDGGFRNIRLKFPELNQSIQRIWARAWREIENDPIRYLRCRGDFSLALVSEARSQSRQISNGDSIYLTGRFLGTVEWIRLTEANASKEFEQAEDLINSHISIGERITNIWQERFRSLAKHSQDVVIVDQWAVRNNNLQGLLRLLRFINQDSNGCRITIYSSPLSRSVSTIENIRRRIWYEAARFDIRKVSSIEVQLFDSQDFGQYAHDRHIRFDHRVIGIGRGLYIFNSQGVQSATGTTYTILRTGAQEYKEESLDNNAKRIETLNIPVGTAML